MPDSNQPRKPRPINVLDRVSFGQILTSTPLATKKLKTQLPDTNWGLGVARVTLVDYEEFFVTLRVVLGNSQLFDRVAVPITWPGAGSRHFFGAMPQVGDHCVVGWMPQESTQPDQTRTPVILAWIAPGTWTGREWVTTAAFTEDEFETDSPKSEQIVRGVFDRIRHKLRHIQPGNIVASSSQGADLVLDEGVTLANRRGNEFRLRDQDQAVVTRALQRFDALAGTRLYSGMVQRDANLLARMMVSDGFEWDGGLQASGGEPITRDELPADVALPKGFLTPAMTLLQTRDSEGVLTQPVLSLDPHINPYTFLKRGGLINERGFMAFGKHSDVVYGGKSIFRVAANSRSNAAASAKEPTLTEYRIEVTHTSDGRLPVTEQTDGFDAERLPLSDGQTLGAGVPPNMPFIEWVLGSVVGNDPYTVDGRTKYGLPLIANVFDGDIANPRLVPVKIVGKPDKADKNEATHISKHAATLFRLSPPKPAGNERVPDTFWSVNKSGQVRMSIGGPKRENSAEVYMHGSLKLRLGGKLDLGFEGGISFATKSKASLQLDSEQGPLTLYGGGPITGAEAKGWEKGGTGKGGGELPSVKMEGRTGVWIRGGQKVKINAPSEVEIEASGLKLLGNQEITLDATKKLTMMGEKIQSTVSGKRQDSYSGPEGQNPTKGALHERTYTPNNPTQTCEEVTYTQGHRCETFKLGDHETTIFIGDYTWQTGQGTGTLRAGTSQLQLSASGIEGIAAVGTVSMNAVAGQATFAGMSGVTVMATGGPAIVKGSVSLYLGAPVSGPDQGPILCSGSLEPFSNAPFATLGTMGAMMHRVGP